MRREVAEQSLSFAAPPSVNNLFFNVVGKGRRPTRAYTDWQTSAGYEIAAQRPGCVAGPYFLTIRVRRATLRRDIGNYEKPISDLLVKMGVVEDDRHCEGIDIRWADEGEGVRVTVVSTKSEEGGGVRQGADRAALSARAALAMSRSSFGAYRGG